MAIKRSNKPKKSRRGTLSQRQSTGGLRPVSRRLSRTLVKQEDSEETFGAPFLFLDLPPEIRNLIYDFSAPSRDRVPLGLRNTQFPQLPEDCSRPDCFALTQVCRQVREEFLPLYYFRTGFQIKLKDMKAFHQFYGKNAKKLATFAKTGQKYRIGQISQLSIVLSNTISFDTTLFGLGQAGVGVDVLAVLKFANQHPEYALQFPGLDDLTRKRWEDILYNKHPNWTEWIKNNFLKEVRFLSGQIGNLRLVFHYKAAYEVDPVLFRYPGTTSWEFGYGFSTEVHHAMTAGIFYG
ncbi:hypothetical protein EJ08DRAFT_691466 [Tothia fuscella]|uniref:2EXR domain-containing protein n=1 Tax=Tothia fuscella TaxID=1048955 RepID=A0A9P4U3S1_9PEZI|nr:hypothetical protein EJ08DRAFT_691466 [Tothia fuscella]